MHHRGNGLVLELSWLLAAPTEQVFGLLTEPAALATWWGPSGFTTPEVDWHPRVRAPYRLGMLPPDGELFHLVEEFVEIDPPRRLAYTFRWEEPDPDEQAGPGGRGLRQQESSSARKAA